METTLSLRTIVEEGVQRVFNVFSWELAFGIQNASARVKRSAVARIKFCGIGPIG